MWTTLIAIKAFLLKWMLPLIGKKITERVEEKIDERREERKEEKKESTPNTDTVTRIGVSELKKIKEFYKEHTALQLQRVQFSRYVVTVTLRIVNIEQFCGDLMLFGSTDQIDNIIVCQFDPKHIEQLMKYSLNEWVSVEGILNFSFSSASVKLTDCKFVSE